MKLYVAERKHQLVALAEDAQGLFHDVTHRAGGVFALSQSGLGGLIRQGPTGWMALQRDVERDPDPLPASILGEVELRAPVLWPSKVMCVGQNYADHCAEQGVPQPEAPIIFSKFPQSIIGPGEAVIHPAITSRLDYEVELAVVIGQGGKNIAEADAMHHVFGYTIANDITARDLQKRDGQWIRAKGCDTFCPLGPCIVTADAVADPHKLALRTFVNGALRQNSNTDQQIFRIPKLIAWVSAAFTLHPGDILLTGTPPGVGAYSKPPSFLQPGDKLRLEIDGIGALENTVAAPTEA